MKFRIKEKHIEGYPEYSRYWVQGKFWWWPFWSNSYDLWDCLIDYKTRGEAEAQMRLLKAKETSKTSLG